MTPKQFKAARKKLGMTQAEIAAVIHVTGRQISNYETGVYAVPPLVQDMLKIMLANQKKLL